MTGDSGAQSGSAGGRDDEPSLTIHGPTVALGPPHRGLAPLMHRWDNDLEVSILSGDPARPSTVEAAVREYERYSVTNGRESALFMLYERATLRPIGITELRAIDTAHRKATFGVIIGERDCWGKGYGTEATILMLDYAFNVLGLNNVMLDVHGFNERAVRAYLRAGFKIVGRRRESYRLGNHVYDEIYMDCLASEFVSPLEPVTAGLTL